MAKKNKIAKTTIATALVASAIIPVAVAPVAAAAEPVSEVVYEKDGKLLSLSFGTFTDALNAEALTDLDIKYVKAADSNYYSFTDFTDALNATESTSPAESLTEALATLAANAETLAKELENVAEGKIEGGVVVGSDDEEPTPVLTVESVSAINLTKVTVNFNKTIDAAAKENFAIAGLTVNAATLSEDKKSVTLDVSEMKLNTEYTVTTTGLIASGESVASLTAKFTSPSQDQAYEPTLTAKDAVLKADGATSTLVTFELRDEAGNLITNAGKVEIAFSTTFGSLAENRVTVQNGKATVLLNSEALTVDRTAIIQARVVEAANANYIGLRAETQVVMSPNPDTAVITTGALMTEVEAQQADRVIAYFDKDVKVEDFVVATGTSKGSIDTNKLKTVVYSGVANGSLKTVTTGHPNTHTVIGLKAVEGNSKALELILATAMVDNSNVVVDFNDLRGNVNVDSRKNFKLTDSRVPALLNVTPEGLNKLVVEFSEPIKPDYSQTALLGKFAVDGIKLSDKAYGDTVVVGGLPTIPANAATVTVGTFDAAKGEDKRHIVTITLGKNAAGKQIYFKAGEHSLQGSNIGDWAVDTDAVNFLNTQTLDFAIVVDQTEPTAQVEVQSPEQYVVTFNNLLNETLTPALVELQVFDRTTNQWVAATKNTIQVTNITTGTSATPTNKYVVETTQDWTVGYNTASTFQNYYNDNYRLVVKKDKVSSVSNGKSNSADIVLPLGGAMTTVDKESPEISAIEAIANTTGYKVTLTEPVKLAKNTAGTITTPNNEGLTPSQSQSTDAGVPVPTAQFVKKDGSKTIPGTIASKFLDQEDKAIEVTPDAVLEAGEWTLIVRSISDDIGNTAASAYKDFTVTGTPATDAAFRVLWARVDSNDTDAGKWSSHNETSILKGRHVFVKFSKPVAVTGKEKNALDTANYTINGQTLPKGSEVIANINGYDNKDNVIDSVTIILPTDSVILDPANTVVNVSKYIESSTGGTLANGGEIKLPFNTGAAGVFPAPTTGTATEIFNAVQAALNNDAYHTVNIPTGFTVPTGQQLVVNRLVDITLLGTATANIVVNATEGGEMKLSGGTLTGDLTVNTPNADFTVASGTTVTGTTTIKDVLSSTFTNAGTLNKVVITDTNGSSFVNTGVVTNPVEINTAGAVTLDGTLNNVAIKSAANVTVAPTATISTITVESNNAKVTLNEGATVNTVNAGTGVTTVELVNNSGKSVATSGITPKVDPLTIKSVATTTSADTTTLTFTFSSSVATTSDSAFVLTATPDTAAATATSATGDTIAVTFTTTSAAIRNSGSGSFTVTRQENGIAVRYTVTVKYVNGRLEVVQPVKLN